MTIEEWLVERHPIEVLTGLSAIGGFVGVSMWMIRNDNRWPPLAVWFSCFWPSVIVTGAAYLWYSDGWEQTMGKLCVMCLVHGLVGAQVLEVAFRLMMKKLDAIAPDEVEPEDAQG